MELKKATIKNFRGIVYRELDFKHGINIIKGENGTGKTSILEAIASGLSLNFMGIRHEMNKRMSGRGLKGNDIRCKYKKDGDGSFNHYNIEPLEIVCSVKNQNNLYDLIIYSEEGRTNRNNTSCKACSSQAKL